MLEDSFGLGLLDDIIEEENIVSKSKRYSNKEATYFDMTFAIERGRKVLVAVGAAIRLLSLMNAKVVPAQLRSLPKRLGTLVAMKRRGHRCGVSGDRLN